MTFKFPPRTPDYVAEEIATVLSSKRVMQFKDIFDIVLVNLRARDLARGGEEMLRLRSHEKLQAFVAGGIATKTEKNYKGVPKMLKEFFKMAAEHNAKVALKLPFKPGVIPKAPVKKARRKIAVVR
jgi:hypothetical protein